MLDELIKMENLYRGAMTISVQDYGYYILKETREDPLKLCKSLCGFLNQTVLPFKKGTVFKIHEALPLERSVGLICIVGDGFHGNCALLFDRKLSSIEKELYMYQPNVVREVRSIAMFGSVKPAMQQLVAISREKYTKGIEQLRSGLVHQDEHLCFMDILHEEIINSYTRLFDRQPVLNIEKW